MMSRRKKIDWHVIEVAWWLVVELLRIEDELKLVLKLPHHQSSSAFRANSIKRARGLVSGSAQISYKHICLII